MTEKLNKLPQNPKIVTISYCGWVCLLLLKISEPSISENSNETEQNNYSFAVDGCSSVFKVGNNLERVVTSLAGGCFL